VATALGELFAQRWHRATGRAPHDAKATSRDSVAWPDGAHVDMEHVDVAIARTQPACNGQPEVREVEQLYLDAIAAARHSIYIENQYLTAKRVGAALAARLAEDDGPEVVLVSGGSAEGWLEQNTMDILRLRFITRLREADRHGQLRVYYPHLPGADGCDLNLHAKVMVVDQCFVRVGSANLNNRSMGFDTECDLAIEAAGEPRIEEAIARFRDRLLAEHLGVAVETVARARTAHGSLIAAIEALSSSGRGLRPLEPRLPTGTALSAEEAWLADPERPMDPDSLIGQFVPGVQYGAGRAARRVFWWLLALAAGFLLALAWRWTPLYEWLDPSPLIVLAERLQQSAAAPLLTLAAFVAAVLLAVPLTLMVVVTVLVFGPWLGYAYSLPGALAGATAAYAVGRLLGRSSLRQLAGSRFGRLVQGLDRRGALTLAMVRVIPVAPFTLLNLAAGAARIRLRDFLLGTLLGLAPGMFAVVLLTNLARNGVLSPGAGTLLALAMVAALVGLAAYQLGKWLMRSAQQAAGGTV
jgi:uncharacterized membrane protein YdjX (TVP38/TMEM64 family)